MSAQGKEVLAQAMEDLAVIRSAVDGSQIEKRNETRKRLHVGLQGLLLLSSCAFIAVEVRKDRQMTAFLQLASRDQELTWFSVAYMSGFLSWLALSGTLIAARSASQNGESLPDHLGRHMRFIPDLSLFSDLFLKFVVLSALLIAGRGDWFAPMLFIFTGDHLVQRRLVHLPQIPSIALGIAAFAAGGLQFYFKSPNLIAPLIGFALISGLSLVHLLKQPARKNA